MGYNTPRPLADKYISGQILDVSTASVAHIPVPAQGTLITAFCSISAALTTANGVITIKKGSTTIGTITLVQSGSAIGQVFEAVMTGTEAARTFAAGDAIVFDGDGACDTTSIGRLIAVMREL